LFDSVAVAVDDCPAGVAANDGGVNVTVVEAGIEVVLALGEVP
jgi:hypothetical protein